MPFAGLQEFLTHLNKIGQLKRIRVEVDPELEITEISQRVLLDRGPALLFENPRGASMPVVMNLFGTMERVRAALGREPSEIGREILHTLERVNPPSIKGLWDSRSMLRRA